MLNNRTTLNVDVSDDEFNLIYSERIRALSSQQWTPIEVAKMAAKYLVETSGVRVLDIGSGVGKFCMVGAIGTQGHFIGVEQRADLVGMANKLAARYSIENVKFVHSNITDVKFAEYDAFYFFNAFYENIDRDAVIDDKIERGFEYYTIYNRYVSGQLSKMPVGTKLVTYWSALNEIPGSYELQFSAFENNLKFWQKVS